MTRAPLLLLTLSLSACPHDFSRSSEPEAGPADATGEAHLLSDIGPPDAPRPDTLAPPDLLPPDTTCIPPCVQTLPGYFKNPRGVAVDSAGTVYVSESNGHRIWRITGGQATVVTGGAEGYQDGLLNDARFSYPEGIALDSAGTIILADRANQRVRAIAAGTVSTLAGDGYDGFHDGPALQAEFDDLQDVALDGAGTIYVADEYNHRIRRIGGNQVDTLAGQDTLGFDNGPLTSARFNRPSGVAVDSAGTIYIADLGNHAIRTIKGQDVSTLAGDGTYGYQDGPGAQARFYYPADVAVDQSGTVYVADYDNHRIRKISVDAVGNATVSTLAGDGTAGTADGPAATAQFHRPLALTVDSSGNVYVADSVNNVVRVIRQK